METVKNVVGLGGKSPRVAWLGLGNMGRGMVKNLVEKGSYSGPVALYNRSPARAEDMASKLPSGKTKVVTDIGEAVQGADIIFICVGDDKAVEETINTALKESGVKGKLFVDCSTIHPDTTDKVAKTVLDSGNEFVASPVFGAPAMAEAGQLVCVLAGPKAAVEKVKPFCKGVIGRAEIDYSDQPQGAATRLKIIGNTFVLSMVEALAEGHTLAEKSGLGTDNLHQFIEAMFPGPYTAYSNRLKTGGYYKTDPLFNAHLAHKDAAHAKNLADSCGAKMKGLEVAQAHLQHVIKEKGNKGDIAGIYGAVREESGLPFEN